MKTALLLVDVQNDYFSGGRMELSKGPETVQKIKDLLTLFREKKLPVVHVSNVYVKPKSMLFYPEPIGADIHHAARPIEGEKVITKNYPNSFRGTELNEYLKGLGVERLVVVGMMTHLCIDATVRAAFDLGYKCIVPGECCATRSLSFHHVHISSEDVQRTFLAAMDGIFARVVRKKKVYELLEKYERRGDL